LSLAFHRLQVYGLAIATAKKAAALDHNLTMVALAIAHWDMRSRTALLAYRQALNLDSRYRDRAFLVALKQAGFSPFSDSDSRASSLCLKFQQSGPLTI